MTTEVLSDMAPRLQKAGQDVRDDEQSLKNSRARRNALVCAAVDEGMTQKQVAQLIGVRAPHVVRILMDAELDDVLGPVAVTR